MDPGMANLNDVNDQEEHGFPAVHSPPPVESPPPTMQIDPPPPVRRSQGFPEDQAAYLERRFNSVDLLLEALHRNISVLRGQVSTQYHISFPLCHAF